MCLFQTNLLASLLLTGYKKFSDDAILIVDVSLEHSELDSRDLVDQIKHQLKLILTLDQADAAVSSNHSFGCVFHFHILQIHPRSFPFGRHLELGDVVVAPVDPIEDGERPQRLGRPKSELSPGWHNAAPGPAGEENTRKYYQMVSRSQYFPIFPKGRRPERNIGRYWLRFITW